MLSKIKSLFSGPAQDDDVKGLDPQLAATALLIEAARADEDYDSTERERVVAILGRRFSMAEAEVTELLVLAESRQEDSVNLHGFTRQVKDGWSEEERVGLIELLWEIAYVDGKIHAYEDHLIRRVAGLIYVTDRERGDARKRVANRLGLSS